MFNKSTGLLFIAFLCLQSQAFCHDNLFGNLIESEKRSDLDCFLDRYGFPQKLSNDIDRCLEDDNCRMIFNYSFLLKGMRAYSNKEEDKSVNSFVQTLNWNEHYIKNGNIDRIVNNRRLHNFINREGLNRLAVAKKYIGIINGEYKILAEEIKGHHVQYDVDDDFKKDISLEEVQQLVHLVKKTGYTDFVGNNLVRDEASGKLVFIDTENGSFYDVLVVDEAAGELYLQSPFALVCALKTTLSERFTEEAHDWLLQEIDKMRNSGSAYTQNSKRLIENSAYDDKDIDFEEVIKEFFIRKVKAARLKANN